MSVFVLPTFYCEMLAAASVKTRIFSSILMTRRGVYVLEHVVVTIA